jgi:hypothetical protein
VVGSDIFIRDSTAITDMWGQAELGPVGLPAGIYDVSVSFGRVVDLGGGILLRGVHCGQQSDQQQQPQNTIRTTRAHGHGRQCGAQGLGAMSPDRWSSGARSGAIVGGECVA